MYYAKDSYDAIKGADALCLLTEWDEFRGLDLTKVKKLLSKNVIFDGRLLLDRKEVEDLGFTYYAVGKRTNAYKGKSYQPTAILNGK